MKEIGEGTPAGARRYQSDSREVFDRVVVGTGIGNPLRVGTALFMITRIDRGDATFDLMPLLAARRYFGRVIR